jgi:hypothetical protein
MYIGFLSSSISTTFLVLVNAYRVFFYPGSLIRKQFYQPFLDSLENRLCCNIKYMTYTPWNASRLFTPDPTLPPRSILIGHSYGAHMALQQAKQNPNVSTCILLNGHFNHDRTLPYSKTNITELSNTSVLVIAGTQDRRLPFVHVLSDMYMADPTKRFIIRNATHFSLFKNAHTVETIFHFIMGHIVFRFPIYNLFGHNPENEYIWKGLPKTKHYFGWWQFGAFLLAKSWDGENHMFHHPNGNVLYKTNGVDIRRYLTYQGFKVNMITPDTSTNRNLRGALLQWLIGGRMRDAGDVLEVAFPNTNVVYYKFMDRYKK